MPIKPTMRYYFMSVRVTIIKIAKTTRARVGLEKGKLSHTVERT